MGQINFKSNFEAVAQDGGTHTFYGGKYYGIRKVIKYPDGYADLFIGGNTVIPKIHYEETVEFILGECPIETAEYPDSSQTPDKPTSADDEVE
mgnify:FL=1|tara:strand:- start:241 stop:519 length:279 start_codon:yes stop_codon:yes gene_type:complete